MLMEAENKQLLTLNNNFGNRHIEFADIQYAQLLDEYYAEQRLLNELHKVNFKEKTNSNIIYLYGTDNN